MIRAVLLGFRLCFMAITKMKLNGKITGGYTSQRMQDDLDTVFPDRESALKFVTDKEVKELFEKFEIYENVVKYFQKKYKSNR